MQRNKATITYLGRHDDGLRTSGTHSAGGRVSFRSRLGLLRTHSGGGGLSGVVVLSGRRGLFVTTLSAAGWLRRTVGAQCTKAERTAGGQCTKAERTAGAQCTKAERTAGAQCTKAEWRRRAAALARRRGAACALCRSVTRRFAADNLQKPQNVN